MADDLAVFGLKRFAGFTFLFVKMMFFGVINGRPVALQAKVIAFLNELDTVDIVTVTAAHITVVHFALNERSIDIHLLQNLADTGVTGTLRIINTDGTEAASLELASGELTGAKAGSLTDDTAVYQILERPVEGRFEFENAQDTGETQPNATNSRSVMSLLMEGMRRYANGKPSRDAPTWLNMVRMPRPLRKPVMTELEIKRTSVPNFRMPKKSINNPTRRPSMTR